MTAWGRLACGLSLAAVALGWCLGWPELAAPGATVAVVGLCGAATSRRRPKLAARLELARGRVRVGGDPGLSVIVTNLGRRRLRGTVLSLPVGRRVLPVRLRRLAPGATAAVKIDVPTGRRARLPVGPAQALRGDPFGLVARTFLWGEAMAVAVYPRTVAAELAAAGMVRDVEGRPTGHPAEADVSFHALRGYQHGDDVRSIHWRSSARLGRVVVRQSDDTRRLHLALILATAAGEYGGGGDFELAVAVYASIGFAGLGQAGELSLTAGPAFWPTAKVNRASLADLTSAVALERSGAAGHGLSEAVALARGRAPRATLGVLVTGAELSPSELARISAGLPAGATALALRCQAGADLAVSRAGRIGIVRLGGLDHLPKLARWWGRP
ncbi:MAG: DUF58 domain-containing protein [Bifidobacteriaceae bacterium]|nr:DUF58 domain-containing protein [Bifidobacteriaceae bacterium]